MGSLVEVDTKWSFSMNLIKYWETDQQRDPSILLDTSDATRTSFTLAAHDSPSMSDCQIADTDELGESLGQSSELDDHNGEEAEEAKAEGKEDKKVKVEWKRPKHPTREEFFEQAIVVAMEKAMKQVKGSL